MESKKCLFCGDEFIPSKNDIRIKYCSDICRKCDRNKNKYTTQWIDKNKDHVWEYRQKHKAIKNAKRRELYATDEKYREKQKEKARKVNRNNPHAKKNQHLKGSFGITFEDYQEILAKQKGKCAICGSTTSKAKQAKYLYVDHDHNTGEIRGLLCNNCNFGIGQFKDDVNLLLKAVEYLRGDHTGKVVDMVQSKRRAGRPGKSF